MTTAKKTKYIVHVIKQLEVKHIMWLKYHCFCLIWPGNHKIYFKQNPVNSLKLEELTEKLAESCSVEEIGFGKG